MADIQKLFNWLEDHTESLQVIVAIALVLGAFTWLITASHKADQWEKQSITDCRMGNTASCISRIRNCTDNGLRDKLEDKYQIATGHSIYAH